MWIEYVGSPHGTMSVLPVIWKWGGCASEGPKETSQGGSTGTPLRLRHEDPSFLADVRLVRSSRSTPLGLADVPRSVRNPGSTKSWRSYGCFSYPSFNRQIVRVPGSFVFRILRGYHPSKGTFPKAYDAGCYSFHDHVRI